MEGATHGRIKDLISPEFLDERQFLINLQLQFNSIRDFIQRRDGACECDLFLENVAKGI